MVDFLIINLFIVFFFIFHHSSLWQVQLRCISIFFLLSLFSLIILLRPCIYAPSFHWFVSLTCSSPVSFRIFRNGNALQPVTKWCCVTFASWKKKVEINERRMEHPYHHHCFIMRHNFCFLSSFSALASCQRCTRTELYGSLLVNSLVHASCTRFILSSCFFFVEFYFKNPFNCGCIYFKSVEVWAIETLATILLALLLQLFCRCAVHLSVDTHNWKDELKFIGWHCITSNNIKKEMTVISSVIASVVFSLYFSFSFLLSHSPKMT